MNVLRRRTLTLCGALAATGIAAQVLTPRRFMANDQRDRLAGIIPTSFAGWVVDPDVAPVSLSPDVKAKLDEIYDDLLERTYVNARGERVMLSIAYGRDQRDSIRLHLPEVCYAAQGFDVSRAARSNLLLPEGPMKVNRLLASLGARHEPITYWARVGDRITLNGRSRKVAQLSYGLQGTIPDGLLVRVSSIEHHSSSAFASHDRFVNALLTALPIQERTFLAGGTTGST